jgi:transposase-like protein
MNDTSNSVKHRNTRYDLNFKRSAVELWQSSGRSAESVADELGISGQTLKTWNWSTAPNRRNPHPEKMANDP